MTPPPWGALGGSDLTAAGLRGLVVCVLRKPVIRALSSCRRWFSKSRCDGGDRDVALEDSGHLADQVAEQGAFGDGPGDGRRHVIRRCPARSEPRGQADTPALPLPQEQAQEDVLARFEVTQQVGLGEPDPAGDIAEGDLPDGPLTRQLASCREDRLPALLLVLGPAGALELVGRRHSPSVPASGSLSEQCCLI